MPLFIHDGGILGIAFVEAEDAWEAKALMMKQFPKRYHDKNGVPVEWTKDWFPELQPFGKAVFLDGDAHLCPFYHQHGLASYEEDQKRWGSN